VAAPGHTPGQIGIRITSEGEQLFCGSDALIHPLHVEQPDWVSMFDYLPEETVVTRRRLLGQAAVDEALVYMHHFPFPGLGRVVLQDGGWRPYLRSFNNRQLNRALEALSICIN
jgi:glyoxylase-like metal-dependent hydrolase (beta-lactamase superfamily II)